MHACTAALGPRSASKSTSAPPTSSGFWYSRVVAFATTIEQIERAERALGRKLPTVLRERLLRDNGGEVEALDTGWQVHPVFDDRSQRMTSRTTSHIVHETEVARGWPRFPADAIAIAADGSGDRLIVRAGSDEIELWDHESGELSSVEIDWT